MIALNETKKLDFVTIGLFDTDREWIHPTVTVETHELIYVTAGEVKIYEGQARHTLRKGDAILLSPGIEHGGFEKSFGRTSFYWLHFYTDDISAWASAKCPSLPPTAERDLREIMHFAASDRELAELSLARFLLEMRASGDYGNRLAHEVREYVRVHSSEELRVERLARQFGYSGDYLSRVYKQEFGHDLKEGITRGRLRYIESLLVNTDSSVKEIAVACGFADENLCSKFFKYHTGLTPTAFRKRFFHIHMNNK